MGEIFSTLRLTSLWFYPFRNGHISENLRPNKSGKSSGESEGSPDELFTVSNRKKPGTLNDNIGRQR